MIEPSSPPTEECSICLEEIKETPNIVLECNHKFHDDCIKQWVDISGSVQHLSRSNRSDENPLTINWSCPLCRLTITEVNNDITESTNIRYLSLIKFKTDRKFIQIVTFTDFIFSFFLIYNKNGINLIYSLCSLYGFIGATQLNAGYLISYSIFCAISFFLRILELIHLFYIQDTNQPDNTVVVNSADIHDYFYLTLFCMTTLLQIYLIMVVNRMCIQIKQYGNRIRLMIA